MILPSPSYIARKVLKLKKPSQERPKAWAKMQLSIVILYKVNSNTSKNLKIFPKSYESGLILVKVYSTVMF